MAQLYHNKSLAAYTSWHIGGPAKILYIPENIHELSLFLKKLPAKEKLYWLGKGSNVLISDTGLDGTVICTVGLTPNPSPKGEGKRFIVGLSCNRLVKYLPFLAGIPGTLGGLLAMNAGAFGKTIWDYVISVETIDRRGVIRARKPQDFIIAYREVKGHVDEWFISANLQLPNKANKQEIKNIIAKRIQAQPINKPTCGSVFRNPPSDSAGRLIEACGLKGYKVGNAEISTKHANFIINNGNATAKDVLALIEHIITEVWQKFGVKLIPEVKIL